GLRVLLGRLPSADDGGALGHVGVDVLRPQAQYTAAVGQCLGGLFPCHELIGCGRADVPGDAVGELVGGGTHLGVGVAGLAEHVAVQLVEIVGTRTDLSRLCLDGGR